MVEAPEINTNDLVIAYRNEATNGDAYYVFINADTKARTLTLNEDLTKGSVLVDNDEAGTIEVNEKTGFELTVNSISIDPLTTIVIKVGEVLPSDPDTGEGENPSDGNNPGNGNNPGEGNNPGNGNSPGEGNNPGNGNNPGEGNNPGNGNNPGEGNNPGNGNNPGEGNNPGNGNNPGEGNNSGNGNNPGEGNNPGNRNNSGEANNSGNGNKPGNSGVSVDGNNETKGNKLPKTATSIYNWLLIGSILLVVGFGAVVYQRRGRKTV